MKQSYIYKFLTLIFSFLLCSQFSFADGSKDLYPSGATGKRAYLVSSDGVTTSKSYPFQNYGVMKVYVKAGETIYVGSSAQGVGLGKINLYAPNVVPASNESNYTATSGTSTTVGKIVDRAQELAGPSINGGTDGGYVPYTITAGAGQEGVWEVHFISAAPTLPAAGPNQPDVLANAEWKNTTAR